MTNLRYPVALTIAGSDSGGGAGIQADLKTFSALGVYGISAITAITAQNTCGVYSVQPVPSEMVQNQLKALFEDFTIDAVKIGMLLTRENVEIVAKMIDFFNPKVVILDPVMVSTTGNELITDGTTDAIISLLFPRITLLTPNIEEASILSGITIKEEKDIQQAAKCIQQKGCSSVLIKGGHLMDEEATDILFIGDSEPIRLSAPAIHTDNTHGTGCTLSSAIAAYVAIGYSLAKATELAKQYITSALLSGSDVKTGKGYGPINHFFLPSPMKKIAVDG